MEVTGFYEELKQKNEDLEILTNLLQAVHKSSSLEEIYRVALDSVMELENVDRAAIYLVDEEKHEAVLEAHRNFPQDYTRRAERIPYPKGITWKVINTGRMLNVEDAQKDPDIGPAGRDLGPHGALGIPIFIEEKVIGVIWFLSYKERKFNERDISLLSTLGSQIAIAIAKAKMFEEMKQRAGELKALYENLKNTQGQLIQSEKLVSLGQLVSSIAHEINNPLTPILGYSQMLLAQPDLDAERWRRFIEIIYTSAERVRKIIENLLSFARKRKPTREYADMNYIVEKALEFRDYQLRLGNIEVVKDLDPELPKTIADPSQLQQVFLNIILNAEQAMGDAHGKGRLVVRTRVKEESVIEISFTDSGPGIPRETLGRIFDPFFTTKPVGEGTGLGLSVAHGIMKAHGGEIYALSEEGKGTTFMVELPVLKKEVVLEPPKIIRGKRVLVVEDEETINSMIRRIFEGEGHKVDLASNGEEALAKIDANSYDLVICDVIMPHMDGKRFYKEVKSRSESLANRIIFITGDISDKTVDFMNETGNRFLEKPFSVEEFKKAIYDQLSKS